jgi:hypothetical protein
MPYVVGWSRAYRLVDQRHQDRVTAANLAKGSAVQTAKANLSDGTLATAIAAAEATYFAAVQASNLTRSQDVAAIEAAKAHLGPGNYGDAASPLAVLVNFGLDQVADVVAVP